MDLIERPRRGQEDWEYSELFCRLLVSAYTAQLSLYLIPVVKTRVKSLI
jgi:hypothetical protein